MTVHFLYRLVLRIWRYKGKNIPQMANFSLNVAWLLGGVAKL